MNALAHRYRSCPSLLLALAALALPAAALAETKVWLKLEFASKDEAALALTELREFEVSTLTSHPPAFRFRDPDRVKVDPAGRFIDVAVTIDSNPDPANLTITIKNDNGQYQIAPSKPVVQAPDKSLIAEFKVKRLVRVRFSPLPFEKFIDVAIRESSGPATGTPPEKAPETEPDHYRSNPIVRAADGYIYFNVRSDDQAWPFRLPVPLAKIPPETDRPFTPAELAEALNLPSGRDNQVATNVRNALVKRFTREFDEGMLRASIRVEDP